MSTDPAGAAALPAGVPGASVETVRTLRFAVGVTLAAALAFAIEWPLHFLTPVLTAAFLASPLPGMTPQRWLASVGHILGAVALGAVFTLFLIPYPLVYVPVLGLVLFHIYYRLNRRGSLMFVLMAILAVLILPMMSVTHDQLALAFAGYFAFSASLSIVLFALAHWLLPDPAGSAATQGPGFTPGYSAPAARAALKSTLAVLPLAVVFVAFEIQSQLLVMIFAAIFSLTPDLSAGWAAGRNSLASTLIGCAAAIVIYWLLVAVPEFHFFLVLWFLSMLVFARLIFSGHPLHKHMGSAAMAMIILVSGSFAPDTDFVDKLVTRVLLICAATVYIVAAMAVLERYVFRDPGGRT